MREIIKKGIRKVLKFTCDWCECQWESDEYEIDENSGKRVDYCQSCDDHIVPCHDDR
jgi:hypothetical protein